MQAEQDGRTWSVVLDLGNGALGALQRHLDPLDVDAVLLSHLHVDHFVDMCGLYVVRKYTPVRAVDGALPVHGPFGTAHRIAAAYGTPEREEVSGVFTVRHLLDRSPVRIGPFTITPYRVNHPVEGYGFRVEADGRVLAYTGDTDTCDALTPLMKDADLVLADSAFVDGRDLVPGIHLSGSRAAEAAVRAGGVRRLMLTHLPSWNDPEVCRSQAEQVWPGRVELAEPGATYEVRPDPV